MRQCLLAILTLVIAVQPVRLSPTRAQSASTPFTGTAVSLPGTVQAENFDNGGPGVAYRDLTAGNSGGAYRATDVDLQATVDTGGGHNVGWMTAGEWLQYTVNVTATASYTLRIRVAALGSGGTFHVEFGGLNKTGPITIPNTGSWQTWITLSKTVSLTAGTQKMRVVLDGNGPTGVFGNVNWMSVTAASSLPAQTAFGGAPLTLPGTVQAENFDNGGAGVAYVDLSTGNSGGRYRSTDVDIEVTSDAGGGYNVGWMAAGEWLEYTVTVATAGTYTLQARVAANGAGGTFRIEMGGVDKTGAMVIPNTGGWQKWTTLSKTVTLGAGTQVLRVVLLSNGPGGVFGNINWIAVSAGAAGPSTLFRQPFLQQVSSTRAVIVWATRAPGTGQIRYQTAGQPVRTSSASTMVFAAAGTGLGFDIHQHVASLTPLSPLTEYSYDVLHNGTDLTPVIDRFRTAPPVGLGPVRFIAFGDSGTGSVQQRQLASRMAADTFDLAVHTGDVAYGTVTMSGGASHRTLHDWFFEIYKGWLRSRPIFPSIGNHDDEIGFGRPYRDVFVLPANGGTPAYPDHAERFYSFDYGPVHFVALDTERAFQDAARRQEQLAWLADDLASTAQPWRVVYFHRSPFSSGAEHGSDLAVRQAFAPLFERYGVQLVISSHDHDYERSVPWRQTSISGGQAVTYVVSGGGGAGLYGVGRSAWTARSASVHHYVRGDVSECELRLDGVGLDGVVFDTVTLDRCGAEAARSPSFQHSAK